MLLRRHRQASVKVEEPKKADKKPEKKEKKKADKKPEKTEN